MNRIATSDTHSQRNAILKVLAVLIIAGISTVASLSAPIIGRSDASTIRLTGIVTDTDCGASHGTRTPGDAQCTRMCVSAGANYALAAGRKVYVLSGHEAELNQFAGEQVLIQGSRSREKTIHVQAVVRMRGETIHRSDD